MEGKDGFLLVFNLCDPASLTSCGTYYSMIKKEAEQKGKPMPSVVLVGNKADMPDKRRVTSQTGQEAAQDLGAGYVETSARTGYNVDKAFEDLVRLIRRKGDADADKRGSTGGRRICALI